MVTHHLGYAVGQDVRCCTLMEAVTLTKCSRPHCRLSYCSLCCGTGSNAKVTDNTQIPPIHTFSVISSILSQHHQKHTFIYRLLVQQHAVEGGEEAQSKFPVTSQTSSLTAAFRNIRLSDDFFYLCSLPPPFPHSPLFYTFQGCSIFYLWTDNGTA